MTTRVFINPTYTRADNGDGGIRRVTEAMHKHLPAFGVTPVMTPAEADVINNHGTSLTEVPGVPMVASCHGLYWGEYEWPAWGHETNAQVVEVLARAVAHTAPSRWVADAMTRGMYIYPEVVYHGVDADDWEPGDSGNYVLWNKARSDLVSNPADMDRVAELLPKVQFVSTFGTFMGNTKIIGRVTLPEMREYVRHADVYLATARETFGIGTLEALACGVPVAGWDYGGQREIIINGETGYLAPYGDYPALAECVRKCHAERRRLGANARRDAIERWGWEGRIAQYAALFKRVHAEAKAARPRVTVLVTCHNLARYLPEALASVQAQTDKDWECLVVDDASADNTPQIALEWAAQDARFRYERTPENLRLPGALNYGVSKARGRYILPVDADNWLDPHTVEVLANALDADAGIHIAYGHLDITAHDGSQRRRSHDGFPPAQFDWRAQMGHLNQIPSTAMYRREVWERSGGYRRRQWRAEDAEFWSRVTSFGFRAKKVTELSCLIYRDRADSKSKGEPGDGNWLAWMPWGYAPTGRDGVAAMRSGKGPRLDLVPWGAQGKPPAAMRFWEVPHCADPEISVIIPVGPNHAQYLIDALDSIAGQTFRNWECIVVFDDGTQPDQIAGAPWARIYSTGPGGKRGPGVARNIGAANARGKLIYYLDADDYIFPWTLEKMRTAHHNNNGALVYGDWLRCDSDGSDLTEYASWDFECGAVLQQMRHSTNVMLPREYHERIGGFDESMDGWEDWDYLIALQHNGLCSVRVPEPLFVYRFRIGERREKSFSDSKRLKDYIRGKWPQYYNAEGKAEVHKMGCGCSKNDRATIDPATGAKITLPAAPDGMVLLEYQGPDNGSTQTLQGRFSGRYYRFGGAPSMRQRPVKKEDAEEFLTRTMRGTPIFTLVGATNGNGQHPEITTPTPAQIVDAAKSQEPARRPEWPVMGDDEDDAPVVLPDLPAPEEDAPAREGIAVPLPDVRTVPVSMIADLLRHAKPEFLVHWLNQERQSDNPRKTVIAKLTAALNKLETASEPG